MILLRICNDLIKRTQHHWVSLRGRVFLLVCSLFPINERSGLNLRGIFSSIEMDKISSAMQGEKSSKQHLPNGPELSPHEQLLSCPPELDINCPFGIFILFFHALDELLDTWEFYWRWFRCSGFSPWTSLWSCRHIMLKKERRKTKCGGAPSVPS